MLPAVDSSAGRVKGSGVNEPAVRVLRLLVEALVGCMGVLWAVTGGFFLSGRHHLYRRCACCRGVDDVGDGSLTRRGERRRETVDGRGRGALFTSELHTVCQPFQRQRYCACLEIHLQIRLLIDLRDTPVLQCRSATTG
eukprot:scpid38055/ scgid10970/ 